MSVEFVFPHAALWLLDGPEAFHRPFPPADGLVLVPAERRRAELLAMLICEEDAARMEKTLASWQGTSSESPLIGGGARVQGLSLARLNWLAWMRLAPEARLPTLLQPR